MSLLDHVFEDHHHEQWITVGVAVDQCRELIGKLILGKPARQIFANIFGREALQ